MPSLFEPFQPGDVLSSDRFNELLLKLQDFETRIHALEVEAGSGGAVVITGFDPPDQVSAGQLLEVEGANFAVPATDNTVTVDGIPVLSFLAGTNSTLLRFIVPPAVPGGDPVPIRVENAMGTAEVLYKILPEIPVVGDPPSFVASGVFNDDLSPQPLIIGGFARVNGQHFAQNPADNVVRFLVATSGGTVTYPTPQIDTVTSNETLIRMEVPDITEAQVGIPRPVTLQIEKGAHPPAAATVIVLRQ